MVKKQTLSYICTQCGAASNSWSGKCYECGEWNTLEQQQILIDSQASIGKKLKPLKLQDAVSNDSPRMASGIGELDNVLGGGLVSGSVNLLAGQPGIGKSTLLLQMAEALALKHKVLYVSGEESAHQIGLRAKRLGAKANNLSLATSNSSDDISVSIAQGTYQIVVVDSIQTVSCENVNSAAGSVSQITNSTHRLSKAAKATGTALVLVGHVTKEGSIAGPKILEHIVDVVLNLEGDRYGGFKMLRAAKNRFGPTSQTGIFEMKDNGLEAVSNPSSLLLEERQESDGSIVFATVEGVRPLLVEVQALVNPTKFGYPKRASSGVDLNRLNLLIAVLEKRTKLNLADHDIYVNIVGGIKLNQPAADLAVCMAIASAAKGRRLKENAVVFGEVGLSGEIRHVPYMDKRISEAKKMGFEACIGPDSSSAVNKSLKYHAVKDLRTTLNSFLSN